MGRKTESADSEWRRKYLERFADQEGQAFLRRFYAKYRGKKPGQVMNLLTESVYPTAVRLATVYRSVFPDRTWARLPHTCAAASMLLTFRSARSKTSMISIPPNASICTTAVI